MTFKVDLFFFQGVIVLSISEFVFVSVPLSAFFLISMKVELKLQMSVVVYYLRGNSIN